MRCFKVLHNFAFGKKMTYVNIILATIIMLFILFIALASNHATTTEPYYQNQMVNGCVMQKSSGIWIRTCG